MKRKIKNTIILAGLVTITLHVLNRLQYSICTVRGILNSPDNQYFEWRFGKIKYTKKGSGSPVLCIHDLSVGSSSYEFHKIVSELSKEHEVYVMDLLGYGLSDKPDMTYTNYLYVQLVNDFIKTIIGKKTDIIASGDSGPIAVMTVHNNPDAVKNLILISPRSISKLNKIPSKQTRIMKFLIDIPILGTFIYNCLTTGISFEKTLKEKYYYNPIFMNLNDITAFMEASHSYDCNSKFSYSSYLGNYMSTNIVHALKEIDHSIYIIAGKEIKDIHPIVENYIYYNNSIEAFYIDKTRQLPHLENPMEVTNQINLVLNEMKI